MRGFGVALLLLLMLCGTAVAEVVAPSRSLVVDGLFLRADDKKARIAEDISGIACVQGPEATRRNCLVINDQDKFAQRAIIEDARVQVGDTIRLIGGQARSGTFGKVPALRCRETGATFKDLDGEAVAFAAPHFYVVGSHGCSRKHSKSIISSFLLLRFKVDAEGKPLDIPKGAAPGTGVEATYRLAETLARTETIAAHFGTPLNSAHAREANLPTGLNVEGMTVIGESLFLGLRAPSLKGKAFIVRVPIPSLFVDDKPLPTPTVLEVPFGDGIGVRDLIALPDGRLLVLGGATEDQAQTSYPVFLLAPDHRTVRQRWELAPLWHKKGRAIERSKPGDKDEMAKAEAMLLLGEDHDALRILVMFDGIENGGPREYKLQIKK